MNRHTTKLSANFASPSRRQPLTIVTAILAGIALTQEPSLFSQTPEPKLKTGDIVYADSGNAIDGGFIIKVDPLSGAQTVLASGGLLSNPFDVAVTANGQIVVSDSGRLIAVNPDTGAQSIIAGNSQALGYPCGIALSGGYIVAANLQAVVAVNPVTGQIQNVSSGGNFLYPDGVTISASGDLFVANMASPAQVVRVNAQNGGQKVIAKGIYLKAPQSIAIQGDDIYVTDVATSDGNFGVGRIVGINARNGKQRIVSEGINLVGPVGIAIDSAGQLIVGDPYTVNPDSADIASGGYDGAIIRIDPATGVQKVIARGQGGAVNPRGVAVVGAP